MNIHKGEHADRTLSSGVEVHLIRHPGSDNWQIRSIDVSWGSLSQGAFATKTWFADKMGLAGRNFPTPEDACRFLEKHLRIQVSQRAPGGSLKA